MARTTSRPDDDPSDREAQTPSHPALPSRRALRSATPAVPDSSASSAGSAPGAAAATPFSPGTVDATPSVPQPPRTRREARRASSEVVSAPAGEPVTIEIVVETTPLPPARHRGAPDPAPSDPAPSDAAPSEPDPHTEPGPDARPSAEAPAPAAVRRGRRAAAPSTTVEASSSAPVAPAAAAAPTSPVADPASAPAPDAPRRSRARRASGPATGTDAPATEAIPVTPADETIPPAPPVPRAGRRAASAFSDTIERPSSGRRARVPVPTTVEIPLPVADGDDETSAATTTSAASATTTAGTGDDPAAAVVPVTAPVGKAVSRRTLRASSLGGPVDPAPASGAHGAARSNGSTVGSKRAAPAERPAPAADSVSGDGVSEADVSTASPGTGKRVARRAQLTTDQAAAVAAEAADASGAAPADPGSNAGNDPETAAAPKKPSGRRRRGDIAKGTFSVIAMIFAAGIAVATTMPASAFHAASGGGADSASAEQLYADVAPLSVAQELTTSPDSTGLGVARDGYGVRDVAALRAAGMRIADTFTNDPNSAVQWPFPVGVPISDGFGPRESPGGIGSTDHKGVDFTPGQGTSIQAIADGVVRTVVPYDGGGLGVHVIIDHVIDGQSVASVYGHMLVGSAAVSEGQLVTVGTPVGRVGDTGTSTGAHLHLEIRVAGTPVDPFAYLESHNA